MLLRKKTNKCNYNKALKSALLCIGIGVTLSFTAEAMAGEHLGSVAKNIVSTFTDVARLISGLSYIAGIGFAIGAILKFKQHKDNPTQIPIGTPVALLFVAAALLFLPSILDVAGYTMFKSGGSVSGPSGSKLPRWNETT